MPRLTEPSLELVQKINTELEYADRLVGHQMSPATGNRRSSLYSFREVTNFLQIGETSELMTKGGGSSIGYIDPTDLRNWVDRVYADGELVAAIDGYLSKDVSLHQKLGSIKELMKERLDGCDAILAAQDKKEDQYA